MLKSVGSFLLPPSVDEEDSEYGGVYLLAMCVLWTWTTVKAIRGGNRKLALAMGVIAFHSVMEHHFTEVNYNILAVMPLAVYAAQAGAGRKKRCAAAGKAWARWIRATVSALLVGLWALHGILGALLTLQRPAREAGWASR